MEGDKGEQDGEKQQEEEEASDSVWRIKLKSSEICLDQSLSPVAVYVMDVAHGAGPPWEIVRRFSQFYELDVQLRYGLRRAALLAMDRVMEGAGAGGHSNTFPENWLITISL